ncbi:MAG: response regulator [Moraxellaceae bacterium]|nr:response regulator [Moraxellaceae bacterium]
MGGTPVRGRSAPLHQTAVAPLRVLVVDDSSLMRRVITGLVKQADGLELVGEAADGLEALEQARTLRPDVILLDIEMPRMDGLGFLRAARLGVSARVIVVSSLARLGHSASREALNLGASDILPKPSGVLSLDLAAVRGEALLAAIRGCRPLTADLREPA